MSEATWRKPIAWNLEARARRQPRFVFCASMSDVFQDHPALVEPRERIWDLIEVTPWLTWLLLTKRPENIASMLRWPQAPPNCWLGTSVENARHTFRARLLVETPAPVHFLSIEPLLGSVFASGGNRKPLDLADIEWVIVGGESGPHFRPMNLDHAREVRDAAMDAGVAYWFKQHSGRFPGEGGTLLDGVEWKQRPPANIPGRFKKEATCSGSC